MDQWTSQQQPAPVDFAKLSACTEVRGHVPNVFRSDWQRGKRIGWERGVATTGNTTTPYGPARSIVTTLLERAEREREGKRWRTGRSREKEGKKEGVRQIAKRSHHATSIPFLSSFARFSFLPSRFSSSSTPIGYLLPTTNVARSFSDVSRRNPTHDSVVSMISRERNLWYSARAIVNGFAISVMLLSVLYRTNNLVCCFMSGEQFPPSREQSFARRQFA